MSVDKIDVKKLINLSFQLDNGFYDLQIIPALWGKKIIKLAKNGFLGLTIICCLTFNANMERLLKHI